MSCTEQVAICIRYTVKEDKKYSAQEDLVAFIPTRDTTVSNLILTQISQWGLDPANIVGQGYDGAGNMSGRVVIQEVQRHAFHQLQNMSIARIIALT